MHRPVCSTARAIAAHQQQPLVLQHQLQFAKQLLLANQHVHLLSELVSWLVCMLARPAVALLQLQLVHQLLLVLQLLMLKQLLAHQLQQSLLSQLLVQQQLLVQLQLLPAANPHQRSELVSWLVCMPARPADALLQFLPAMQRQHQAVVATKLG